MKKLAAFVLPALLAATSFADAAPTTGAPLTTAAAPVAAPQVQVPTTCDAMIDSLVADTATKSNVNAVYLVATLIAGDTPFATPNYSSSSAKATAGKLAG